MTTKTIGEVAELAAVSVRTLRHYDEIGLLRCSQRSPSGYRVYNEADLARLEQILAYRELGLALEEIALLLADPTNRQSVLRDAKARVVERIARLTRIAESLETAIANGKEGTDMNAANRLGVFEGFDPDEVAEEAESLWGDSEAFAESIRRTSKYTPDDWKEQKAAEAQIYSDFVALLRAGTPADAAETAALVDAHRSMITEWFYECTPQIHVGLGQIYVSDPRFTTNINKAGDGLAQYLSAAIAARYDG